MPQYFPSATFSCHVTVTRQFPAGFEVYGYLKMEFYNSWHKSNMRLCLLLEQGWSSAGRSCVSYSVRERHTESEGELAAVALVC